MINDESFGTTRLFPQEEHPYGQRMAGGHAVHPAGPVEPMPVVKPGTRPGVADAMQGGVLFSGRLPWSWREANKYLNVERSKDCVGQVCRRNSATPPEFGIGRIPLKGEPL